MAAVALALPPCYGCAGGGEVNGLECRECGGSSRAGSLRRSWGLRKRLLAAAHRVSVPAGKTVGTVLRWSASLPGLAGAAGVSYGSAAVVHAVFRQVPLLAVAAIVAGAFALALDRRL